MTKVATNVTPAFSRLDLFWAAGLGSIYVITLFLLGRSLPVEALAVALALIPLSLWVSVQDLKDFTIPNTPILFIAALGAVFSFVYLPELVLLYAFSSFGLLFVFGVAGEAVFRITGTDAFGYGDAKLIAACSMCCGVMAVPTLLLVASIGGIIVALLQLKRGKSGGIAFGPHIVFANFLVWLTGPIQF